MERAILDLIADLDVPNMGTDEEAQATLIASGDQVIQPLIAAVQRLERGGQLCAIEIFRALHAVQAGPPLIPLLESQFDTVRDWTAQALGEWRTAEAVPALQQAERATRERGTPPFHTEPCSIRWALTRLGARAEVTPPLTGSLSMSVAGLDQCWPTMRLREVLDELAEHDQAVLFVQFWRLKGERVHWQQLGIDWTDEIDFTVPWRDIVERTNSWACLEAESVPSADDLVATICWINENDL